MEIMGYRPAEDAPIVPLKLTYEICETSDNVLRNLEATLSTDYVPFNDLLAKPHNREISIVGFGPSLKDTYLDLRGDVWACNGSHDWLIDRGIIPMYAMFWDAHELTNKFVQNLHIDVSYLVASRCHRSVFKAVENYRHYVWHAMGDAGLEELLIKYNKMEPMLHGGSAAVTRAMVVALTMGYRKINLFGADSSFISDNTHVEKSVAEESQLDIFCNGEWFKSTSWLAGQAEDFKEIAPNFKQRGIDLQVYGSGLIPSIAKNMGFIVHQ